ncbi:type III secretion system outer membrane ring subunit SctC [Pseudomonas sp. HY7a-MNA-CIBAN-0227]|uniref:type III secretion system outer membrane ring subunit SctC n=1 Tax=Pseudomonas sp. HY7a-MNA-CIBAN-0227 TaxID=3140474 RepID=UPI0033172113
MYRLTVCLDSRRWLLCCLLMLGSAPALGEVYQAHDESLQAFFTELSVPLGQPIVVSKTASGKRISGQYDFDPVQRTLEEVALQQGLIWYSDGQVLYLYDVSEAKSAVVSLRHISVDMLRAFMRRTGLSEARYPLREGGARMFYVSGPPNYVDQVLRLAQLMDRQRAELRMGPQKIGVVQVLNTHVADRQYDMGSEQITVPGMATMIGKLLATEQKNVAPGRSLQSGLLADKNISVMAYPDTNSLLIKGMPAQVRFLESLVAELDVPKRSVEVSLWLVDVDRHEFEQMGMAPDGDGKGPDTQRQVSRVLAPVEDRAFMARVQALERRRRARVVALPVILTQENVPAVFHDNQTLYLPRSAEDSDEWQPINHGTQVSVLPRFAEANEIEMLLTIEDGRQIGKVGGRDGASAAVGRVGINTVVRVAQGKRLLLGSFRRDGEAAKRSAMFGRYDGPMTNSVRLFLIQAQAVGDELKTATGQGSPPPLTAAQYEHVQGTFTRSFEQ